MGTYNVSRIPPIFVPIFMVLFVVLFVFIGMSCCNSNSPAQQKQNEVIEIQMVCKGTSGTVLYIPRAYILTDKETGVEYIVVLGGDGLAITPRLPK